LSHGANCSFDLLVLAHFDVISLLAQFGNGVHLEHSAKDANTSLWSFLFITLLLAFGLEFSKLFLVIVFFRKNFLSFAHFFRQLSFLDQLVPKKSRRISGRASTKLCDQSIHALISIYFHYTNVFESSVIGLGFEVS
jgi:hypothetical protein